MRSLFAIVTLGLALPMGAGAATLPAPLSGVSAEVVYHGGGCRKSSPPGRCCHMDNSTGRVHCH